VRGRVPGDIAEILIADDYPHRIARRVQPPMTHNHPHQPPSISGTLHHNTHTAHVTPAPHSKHNTAHTNTNTIDEEEEEGCVANGYQGNQENAKHPNIS